MPEVMVKVIQRAVILNVVVSALIPANAFALDQQLQVGGDFSFAYEFADPDGYPGGGAGVHIRYGITDAVAVGGAIAWAGQVAPTADPDGDESELRHLITAATGFVYALDIIRIVPYFSLMAGAAVAIQEETTPSFLVNIAGGFDFILNRSIALGAEVGYQLMIGEELYPARIFVSIRVNWQKYLL